MLARYATSDARLTHYDEFRARVEKALAGATTAEWQERLERAAIAAGPGYELDEVFAGPQIKPLQVVAEVEQPGYGPARMLHLPLRAPPPPAALRPPPPPP